MSYILGYLLCSRCIWERDVLPEDVGEGAVAVLAFEGRGAVEHLIYQDAQRPPIYRTGMTTALDDLWCNILLSTDKRVCAEVGDARTSVDMEGRLASTVLPDDHGRLAAGVGLLGQVEV